jgi:hypothetical protein
MPRDPHCGTGRFCTQRVSRTVVGDSPGPLPQPNGRSVRMYVAFWQILLQKSLAILLNDDSVAALMRFAVEAIDDGAAQSRPRQVFLFVSS